MLCLLKRFGVPSTVWCSQVRDTRVDPLQLTPTIGLNVGEVNKFGLKMVFWDLGGDQSRAVNAFSVAAHRYTPSPTPGHVDLQCLWEKYYREVHAIVYVVDASAPDRLRDSKTAFDSMVDSRHADGLPILVLVNKCDIEGAMSISEVKEVFNESAPKLGVRDCKVLHASAVTGCVGPHDAFLCRPTICMWHYLTICTLMLPQRERGERCVLAAARSSTESSYATSKYLRVLTFYKMFVISLGCTNTKSGQWSRGDGC